jgi:hypothetical protein
MQYIEEFNTETFPWSKEARHHVDAINASPQADTIWCYFKGYFEGGEELPDRGQVNDCMETFDFPYIYDGLRVYDSEIDFFVFKDGAFDTIAEKLEDDSPEYQKYLEIKSAYYADEISNKFDEFVGADQDVSFSEYKQFIMDYKLEEDEDDEDDEDNDEA